jgi:hypothetical protein
VLYTSESTPPPAMRARNKLLPQLRPPMDEYLKDVQQLNTIELPFVLGFINQVLNASNSLQDYLRLLPESVHRPVLQMVASCPCHTTQLPDERVLQLVEKNVDSIALMKQRLVTNLLI